MLINNSENFREKENEVDLIIQPNKKKPNRLMIVEDLKKDLSNDQNTINKLFKLISNTNEKTGEAVWELIKFLPVNSKFKENILNLNIDGTMVLKSLVYFNKT